MASVFIKSTQILTWCRCNCSLQIFLIRYWAQYVETYSNRPVFELAPQRFSVGRQWIL